MFVKVIHKNCIYEIPDEKLYQLMDERLLLDREAQKEFKRLFILFVKAACSLPQEFHPEMASDLDDGREVDAHQHAFDQLTGHFICNNAVSESFHNGAQPFRSVYHYIDWLLSMVAEHGIGRVDFGDIEMHLPTFLMLMKIRGHGINDSISGRGDRIAHCIHTLNQVRQLQRLHADFCILNNEGQSVTDVMQAKHQDRGVERAAIDEVRRLCPKR